MTHREKIDQIARRHAVNMYGQVSEALVCDYKDAILAAIEAVLGAEPTEGMEKAGATQDFAAYVIGIYRAMSAELIKELKC